MILIIIIYQRVIKLIINLIKKLKINKLMIKINKFN